MKRITYGELTSKFREHERGGYLTDGAKRHLVGFVVVAQESFNEEYSLASRTYRVTSDSKAFIPNMGGYSIFAYSLDGTDDCRLEGYLKEERGGDNGWVVEYCYMEED